MITMFSSLVPQMDNSEMYSAWPSENPSKIKGQMPLVITISRTHIVMTFLSLCASSPPPQYFTPVSGIISKKSHLFTFHYFKLYFPGESRWTQGNCRPLVLCNLNSSVGPRLEKYSVTVYCQLQKLRVEPNTLGKEVNAICLQLWRKPEWVGPTFQLLINKI